MRKHSDSHEHPIKATFERVLLIVSGFTVAGCSLFDIFGTRASGPTVVWHVAGEGVSAPGYDGTMVYFLSADRTVVALDAATGERRWTSRTFDSASGRPFGYGGCEVAGALVICNDSDLVAFRRADGVLAWRYHPAIGHFPGYAGFVIRNGILFAGSPTGTVYAVDAATGEERWVQGMLTGTGTTTNVTQIAVDDELVAAPFTRFLNPQRGGIMAPDSKTGELRWITDYPRPASDSLTGAYSSAFWSSLVLGSCADGRIYALDRTSGAVQWALPGVGSSPGVGPVGADIRTILVSESTLYAGSISLWFTAYDLNARRERWRLNVDGADEGFRPVVADNTIYHVANIRLNAISTDGKKLWDYGDYKQTFRGRPVVTTDRIFISGSTGFWAFAR